MSFMTEVLIIQLMLGTIVLLTLWVVILIVRNAKFEKEARQSRIHSRISRYIEQSAHIEGPPWEE